MARFIQTPFPVEHEGIARVERGLQSVGDTVRGFRGARGAATLLLAALVSALLVVANEVIETWTEGHLLAAWIVMWVIGFAALALLAEPARRIAGNLRETFAGWRAAYVQSREDARMWEVALSDARVMADLSRAMSRDALRDTRAYY